MFTTAHTSCTTELRLVRRPSWPPMSDSNSMEQAYPKNRFSNSYGHNPWLKQTMRTPPRRPRSSSTTPERHQIYAQIPGRDYHQQDQGRRLPGQNARKTRLNQVCRIKKLEFGIFAFNNSERPCQYLMVVVGAGLRAHHGGMNFSLSKMYFYLIFILLRCSRQK